MAATTTVITAPVEVPVDSERVRYLIPYQCVIANSAPIEDPVDAERVRYLIPYQCVIA